MQILHKSLKNMKNLMNKKKVEIFFSTYFKSITYKKIKKQKTNWHINNQLHTYKVLHTIRCIQIQYTHLEQT